MLLSGSCCVGPSSRLRWTETRWSSRSRWSSRWFACVAELYFHGLLQACPGLELETPAACSGGVTQLHSVTGTAREQPSYNNQKGDAARNITMEEYHDMLDKTPLPEGRRIGSQRGLGLSLIHI